MLLPYIILGKVRAKIFLSSFIPFLVTTPQLMGVKSSGTRWELVCLPVYPSIHMSIHPSIPPLAPGLPEAGLDLLAVSSGLSEAGFGLSYRKLAQASHRRA